MIVITLTDCPHSLRGDLTKWLIEINTGVFVGRVSARVRDNLWKRVVQNVKNGRATLVYNTNNEQRMDFRIHHSENEIIDFDGLKLVMKPSPARTKSLTKRRMGFSKAGRMRMVKKVENHKACANAVHSVAYPSDYVVVDLETSGLDVEKNEIIEVGMLRVYRNEIVETFHALIKPEQLISKRIEKLTGMTNEFLKREGKQISDVLPNIRNFIGKEILLGHNINFDINFLNRACSRYDQGIIDNQHYDTMKLYAEFSKDYKAKKKLVEVAGACEIPVDEYHRGLADCYTVKAVYDVLRIKLGR